MKKEKLILVGHGASGKDYLASKMIDLGLRKSISYTTRPKRSSEKDGEDYHFVTVEKFKYMISNDELYEYDIFKKDWYYGSSNEDWNESNLFIKTVEGVSKIKHEDRENCFIVFLDIPRDIRYQRLLERNDNNDDLNRRLDADEKDFESFTDYDLRISDPDYDYMMVFHLMN